MGGRRTPPVSPGKKRQREKDTPATAADEELGAEAKKVKDCDKGEVEKFCDLMGILGLYCCGNELSSFLISQMKT